MSLVTIIIPAFNAGHSIAETIASVQAQRCADWRVVVIDDGSTDHTAAIVSDMAGRDDRIRLIQQSNGGLSAARNRGIAEAETRYVLFLDADDSIAPDHLETLLAATAEDDECIAYSRHRRVAADGRVLAETEALEVAHSPAIAFAYSNKLAVHAVLVPRAAFARVGLFDSSLATCEDWDLWQRLARAGMRFVATGTPTAFYHIRSDSMSRNFTALAQSALEVLARCRRADPRVQAPPPQFADGLVADGFEAAASHFLLWCATASLAADRLFAPVTVPANVDLGGQADNVVATLRDGLAIGAEATDDQIARAWNRVRHELAPILERFCAGASEDGLLHRIIYMLERDAVRDDPLATPLRMEKVHGERVDIHAIHALDDMPDLVHLRVNDGEAELLRQERPAWGSFDVPAVQALISADLGVSFAEPPQTLGTRVSQKLKRLLSRRAAEPVNPVPDPTSSDVACNQIRQKIADQLASITAEPIPDSTPEDFPAGDYSREYWDQFFDRSNPWHLDDLYEQRKYRQALSLIDGRQIGRAAEIGCAEGHFTILLAPLVQDLVALDIAEAALTRAAERCAALDNISYVRADFTRDPLPDGLDLVVCSEILYYLPGADELQEAARILRDSLHDGGLLLTAHSLTVQDDPDRTGFDWSMPHGAESFAKMFAEIGGLVLERSLRSELYRIDLWRRDEAIGADARVETIAAGLPRPAIQRGIRWGGIVARAEDLCAATSTRNVPILMYHMVGMSGPPATDRYRIDPGDFEQQLRLLRRHGFYPINSAQLDWYRSRGEALPGRPVMLTFDDGYRDFFETAWPILYRNNFLAEVFVVTGKVGGVSDWDRRFGTPQPLMDWPEIAMLNAQGITFGSHLATHRHVDSLSSAELFDEALRSRLMLERKLGCEIHAIAAPSGGLDERAIRVFDLAGYHICYSTREGTASIDQHSLNLPRIEVYRGMPIDEFATKVGLA